MLGKLSYGCYLIHPIVLSLVYWSRIQPYRYTALQFAYDYSATWVLSNALSALTFVLIEKPFLEMEAVLFRVMKW